MAKLEIRELARVRERIARERAAGLDRFANEWVIERCGLRGVERRVGVVQQSLVDRDDILGVEQEGIRAQHLVTAWLLRLVAFGGVVALAGSGVDVRSHQLVELTRLGIAQRELLDRGCFELAQPAFGLGALEAEIVEVVERAFVGASPAPIVVELVVLLVNFIAWWDTCVIVLALVGLVLDVPRGHRRRCRHTGRGQSQQRHGEDEDPGERGPSAVA